MSVKFVIMLMVLPLVGLAVAVAPAIVRFLRMLFPSRLPASRRSARKADNVVTCLRCGYDMRGLDTPRCPECGTLRGFKVPMADLGLTEEDIQKAGARKRLKGQND